MRFKRIAIQLSLNTTVVTPKPLGELQRHIPKEKILKNSCDIFYVDLTINIGKEMQLVKCTE